MEEDKFAEGSSAPAPTGGETQSSPDKIRIPNIRQQNIFDDMHQDENVGEPFGEEQIMMMKLEEIGDSGRNKHKTFEGIPKQWHQTMRVKNPDTQRVKLFFRCKYPGCGSEFKKSCNLRDHFRKHTGLRPFSCKFCLKTFTQSGNLGRHLKNVHSIGRELSENELPKDNQEMKNEESE